jgi:alpha-L-rhamnosidase
MSDSQCALALALNFDLALEDDLRQTWADRLDYLVRNSVFKVATGFAGTPIILDTLTRHGKLHLAYRMLQEKQCPSWLYPVSMGATTIWERWDSMLPSGDINPGQMTSFNHYALGSVATFLHGVVGGISPLEPGWRKILVRPQPGGTVTHASAKHLSPYGTIECSWKIINSRLQVRVCIPPNATARVVLPGVDEEIGSGIRDYEVRWEEDPRWPPRGIQLPFTQPIVDEFV